MSPAPWATAASRWARRPLAPGVPLMAAMRSSHRAVDWLAILPPPPADALADQSAFTYSLAPAKGLSTRAPGGPPGVVVVVDRAVVGVDGVVPVVDGPG